MKPKTKLEGAKYAGFVMMGRNCNCFDKAFKRNPAYDGPSYSPALPYAIFMQLSATAKTKPEDAKLNRANKTSVRCERGQGLTSIRTLMELFNVPKNQVEVAIKRLIDNGLIKWETCKDMPNANILNGSRYTILQFIGLENQPFASDSYSDEINNNNNKAAAKTQLPPEYDTPEFKAMLDDFTKHRAETKKPATPTAMKMVVNKLVKAGLGHDDAIDELANSIERGWASVCYDGESHKAKNALPAPKVVKGASKRAGKMTGMDAAFAMDEQYNKPRKVA